MERLARPVIEQLVDADERQSYQRPRERQHADSGEADEPEQRDDEPHPPRQDDEPVSAAPVVSPEHLSFSPVLCARYVNLQH